MAPVVSSLADGVIVDIIYPDDRTALWSDIDLTPTRPAFCPLPNEAAPSAQRFPPTVECRVSPGAAGTVPRYTQESVGIPGRTFEKASVDGTRNLEVSWLGLALLGAPILGLILYLAVCCYLIGGCKGTRGERSERSERSEEEEEWHRSDDSLPSELVFWGDDAPIFVDADAVWNDGMWDDDVLTLYDNENAPTQGRMYAE